ncbi:MULTISPECIES: hypothetical protein [Streptomyces]|uniref:hypothetical protein n=1 Tax=Streptomyces TaxID=1883 RepID=UPI0011817493|nr:MULTISPECIES: hypothetical protein [unclassified Streptomyces]
MTQTSEPDYRLDVAALLKEGQSDRAIMRELHCGVKAVRQARAALGITRTERQGAGYKAAASVEDSFRERTQGAGDGHLVWTGYVENGHPRVRHGGQGGRRHSAYKIAYRIRTGSDPTKRVAPTCGRAGCVAPDHVDEVGS